MKYQNPEKKIKNQNIKQNIKRTRSRTKNIKQNIKRTLMKIKNQKYFKNRILEELKQEGQELKIFKDQKPKILNENIRRTRTR